MIFESLGAESQICLGLTCKAFDRILHTIDLNLSIDQKKFIQQLKTWMPLTYKLCQQCNKYILTNGKD